MPILTLHRRQMFKLSIPYWVFINEHPIGIMQSKEVSLELPPAQFDLSIKILFRPFKAANKREQSEACFDSAERKQARPKVKWQFSLGGKRKVLLSEGEHLHLTITDKERWWNILFDIDLILWLAKMFFELPHPWNIVYEVVSNGFFALWLARIWFIRDSYFKIVEQNLKPNV